MPKIQLGTRDYLNFAKGWLGIHMTYSHGWFDNQGSIVNAYLHQKTLYGRIGKPNSKISAYAGINHNVSWAGETKTKLGNEFDVYPTGLNTYFYVVTLLKNRSILPIDSNASNDDLGYQFGNHLGSIDVAFKINSKLLETLIYRQSMYETGRIASLAIINDGLTGISFKLRKNYFLDNIGFEYLYTANQGNYLSGIAKYLGLIDPHKIEVETYQNNGGRGSWKYWNKSIGTPIFIIDRESVQGGGNYFSLNAIKSIHLFFSGKFKNEIYWKFRFSNSFYAAPRNHLSPRLVDSDFLKQTSCIFIIEKRFSKKLKSELQIGFDKGYRIVNSIGTSLNLQYKFK